MIQGSGSLKNIAAPSREQLLLSILSAMSAMRGAWAGSARLEGSVNYSAGLQLPVSSFASLHWNGVLSLSSTHLRSTVMPLIAAMSVIAG